MYKVKLDVFEGPFDLLVYLIEHARMNIYDIRISEITTQYLEAVYELKKQDVNIAQDFMVLAAELIELKSRMLLPRQTGENGEDEEDPRTGLVAKLLEYKQFKALAAFLSEQQLQTEHIHTKAQEDLSVFTGEADIILKTDMEKFTEAFKDFLTRKHRMEEVRRIYEYAKREKLSVETRISQIRELFKSRNTKVLMFSDLIGDNKTNYNLVISFMSLLELLKEGSIEADQKERYGDISVKLVK